MARKRRKGARTRDWEQSSSADYSHERKRFRGIQTKPAPPPPTHDFSSDIVPNALVVSPYGALAFVSIDGREVLCRVDQPLMRGKNSMLSPGDRVLIDEQPEQPLAIAVAPRRTKLSRPDILRGNEQVIAANIEQLVIVAAAAHPAFKQGLVDRYLIAAAVGDVPATIFLNKIDLVDAPPDLSEYQELGVNVIYASCVSGSGLEELRAQLTGKLSVLAGHSGVGKSTIIKKLAPGLELVTREVSRSTQKGQHTTTASRLYDFEGIRIIDTPGIRQLGVWGVSPAELAFFFPEMAALAGGCKFRDCTHTHEPGCAVVAALDAGDLSRVRYRSYLRIRESMTPE